MEKKKGDKQVQSQPAGDVWLNYIKQFEKLDGLFNMIPEPTRRLFAQQIDIFAGKYPSTPNQSDELQEARKEIERLEGIVGLREKEIGDLKRYMDILRATLKNIKEFSEDWDSPTHNRITETAAEALKFHP